MPTLRENPDRSDEATGYYVVAEVDGGIVTLDTPELVIELYAKLDFNAGDELPGRLVWKLYELGFHEIDGSDIPVSEVEDYAETHVSRDLTDIELSDERVREIHDFMLERFPEHGRVMKLGEAYGLELLEEHTPDEIGDIEHGSEPAFQDEVAAEAAEEWGLTDEEIDSVTGFDGNRGDFELEDLTGDLYIHPREVVDLDPGLYQTYTLSSDDLSVDEFLVHDYRLSDTESLYGVSEIPGDPASVDFQIEFRVNNLTHWFTVRDGWIIRQATVREEVQLEPDGDFGEMSVESDRFRHKLLMQRDELLDVIYRFFKELRNYIMSSSGLEKELARYREEITWAVAPHFDETEELEELLWLEADEGLTLVRVSVKSPEKDKYRIKLIRFTESDVWSLQTGFVSEGYSGPEVSATLDEEARELRLSGQETGVWDGSWRSKIPVTESISSRLSALDSVNEPIG